jgi:LPS O-antigen subunit length determinant protein (WzzB/FepE family)
MIDQEHRAGIEVIEAFALADEPDGPARPISPRRAAWIVDGAVVIASAYGPVASCGELLVRRSHDARPQP